jgi:hypothetical protein
MTGLLEFLGRPSDPASFPFYIRRCRERVHELQANIRRLEDEKQRLINEIHEIQHTFESEHTSIDEDLNLQFDTCEIEDVIELDASPASSASSIRETRRLSQSQRVEAENFCAQNPQFLPTESAEFGVLDFTKFPVPVLQLWCAHFGLKSRGVSRTFMLNHLRDIQNYLCGLDSNKVVTPPTSKRVHRPTIYKWFGNFIQARPELYQKILNTEELNLIEVHAAMESPPAGVEFLRDYFQEYNIKFS